MGPTLRGKQCYLKCQRQVGFRNWNTSSRREFWRHEALWKVSAARCVGTSHERIEVPCQDQVYACHFGNGVTVVAVADGAGSARFSHYGAELAVKRSAELVACHFDEIALPGARAAQLQDVLIKELQRELVELSRLGLNLTPEERAMEGLCIDDDCAFVQCELRELSSTLLLAAIKGNRFFILHIGDGVIGAEVVRANRRRLMTLSSPDNGEFVNETRFLTSSDAATSSRCMSGRLTWRKKAIVGFILMSDGPESTLYQKRTRQLGTGCLTLLEANRTLLKDEMERRLFATLKSVVRQKTSDDCSIALMSRTGFGTCSTRI